MRSPKTSIEKTWLCYGFAFVVATFAFFTSISIDFDRASSTFGSHEAAKTGSLVTLVLNDAEAGKAKITAKATKKKKMAKSSKKGKKTKKKKTTKSRNLIKEKRPIVLGGGARYRSEPVGKKYGYGTYQPRKVNLGSKGKLTQKSKEKLLRKNERWIKDQIRSGRRIYDVGKSRDRSMKQHEFYQREVKVLKSYGYKRVKRGWVSANIDGKIKRMRKYEWAKE